MNIITLKDIKIQRLESGLLWPFYKNNKAWSASKLTNFIKMIEYKDIPAFILNLAATRGKIFHEVIQTYFQNGNYPSFVDTEGEKLNKTQKRIKETIIFFKKTNILKPSVFLGAEELHYTLHQEDFIAAYSDINFADYIIELKTSSIKTKDSVLLLLVFDIQLLIQHLCTGKDVYLVWSTGEGMIFNKFKKNLNLLNILNILIAVAREEEKKPYSEEEKKEIIKKILEIYQPNEFNVFS